MASISPFEFLQQVRAEAQGYLADPARDAGDDHDGRGHGCVHSIFFLLSDQIFSRLVALILSLGH